MSLWLLRSWATREWLSRHTLDEPTSMWTTTTTTVMCFLAATALYIGTAIAASIIHLTIKGVVGVDVYYGATSVAPIVIGVQRSRSASLLARVRHVAALSLAAQLNFLPVALAALAM